MKGTIKSQERIGSLFARGNKYVGAGFLSLYDALDKKEQAKPAQVKQEQVKPEAVAGKVAFIAGKKLGTAPVRNRAKRRLREAARAGGAPWRGHDVVFVARQGILEKDFTVLVGSINRLGILLEQAESQDKAAKETLPEAVIETHEEAAPTILDPDEDQETNKEENTAQTACNRPEYSDIQQLDEELMPVAHQEERATGRKSKTIFSFLVGIPRNLTILCINIYRHAISPLFPPSCRYVPTCSEYALIALQRFGFWRGLLLAVKRVGRCHPFYPGGYDPVPEVFDRKLI